MFGIFCDLCARQIENTEDYFCFRIDDGILGPAESVNSTIHLCCSCAGTAHMAVERMGDIATRQLPYERKA